MAAFAALSAAHARLLAGVTARDAAAVEAALHKCRELGGPELKILYDSFERRVEERLPS